MTHRPTSLRLALEHCPAVLEAPPDRASWLARRREIGIGSSEVSALFSNPENPLRGLTRYATPFSVWTDKLGNKPDDGTIEWLEWRRRMEPALADWFAERIQPETEHAGAALEDPGDFAILRHPSDPMFATVDRLLVAGGKPVAIVELKTAAQWMDSAWIDEPPLPYQLQVQAQLHILGLERGYLVVSIGGQVPRWAVIDARPKMQKIIRGRVRWMWDLIQRQEPPQVDAEKVTGAAILWRWPEDDGERVPLPDEALELWEERERAHQAAKGAAEKKEALTNQLKVHIGSASEGVLRDGRILTLRKDRAGRRILRMANYLEGE